MRYVEKLTAVSAHASKESEGLSEEFDVADMIESEAF